MHTTFTKGANNTLPENKPIENKEEKIISLFMNNFIREQNKNDETFQVMTYPILTPIISEEYKNYISDSIGLDHDYDGNLFEEHHIVEDQFQENSIGTLLKKAYLENPKSNSYGFLSRPPQSGSILDFKIDDTLLRGMKYASKVQSGKIKLSDIDVSKLPIYFLLEYNHSSLLIFLENKVYLLGYGMGEERRSMFSSKTKYSNASILINDFINKIDFVGKRSFKIGDIGVVTKNILDPMLRDLRPENVKDLYIYLRISHSQGKYTYNLQQFNINMNEHSSYSYHMYSIHTPGYKCNENNCMSFLISLINNVYPSRIICNMVGIGGYRVAKPGACFRNGYRTYHPFSHEIIDPFFILYTKLRNNDFTSYSEYKDALLHMLIDLLWFPMRKYDSRMLTSVSRATHNMNHYRTPKSSRQRSTNSKPRTMKSKPKSMKSKSKPRNRKRYTHKRGHK